MTLTRLIVAFAMSAALATYLMPDDNEPISRSLASYSNSQVQDPRTVQRKIPASTSNTVSVDRTQTANKAKADASFDLKPIPQGQQVGNLRQVPTESRRESGPLSVVSRAATGRVTTTDQGQSLQVPMTTKLRPIQQTSAEDGAHQSSDNIQALVPSTLPLNTVKSLTSLAEAVGGRDAEVALTRTAVDQAGSVQPLVPTKMDQAIPVEKARPKQDENDEEEHKEIVPTNQDKMDDAKDDALDLQKLLRESGSDVTLPGQGKVDELLKAHRSGRDVDDLSNKDAEKERFFRLMYGRSKPNKTGEY